MRNSLAEVFQALLSKDWAVELVEHPGFAEPTFDAHIVTKLRFKPETMVPERAASIIGDQLRALFQGTYAYNEELTELREKVANLETDKAVLQGKITQLMEYKIHFEMAMRLAHGDS